MSLYDKYYKRVKEESILSRWENSYGKANLYIHSPFCASQCKFCYYSGTPYRSELMDKYYKEYLPDNLAFYGDVLGNKDFKTAYFGGGTVSMVPIKYNQKIFDSIPGFEAINAKVFEIHPGVFDMAYLPMLWEYGFRFLVVSVQTFNVNIIKAQGRVPYTAQDIQDLKEEIDKYGFYTCIDLLIFEEEEFRGQEIADLYAAKALGFDQITTAIDFRFPPEHYNIKDIAKGIANVLEESQYRSIEGECLHEGYVEEVLADFGSVRCFGDRMDYDELNHLMDHFSFTMTNVTFNNKPHDQSLLGIGGFKNKCDTFSMINQHYIYIERNDDWERKFYEQYNAGKHKSLKTMTAEYYAALDGIGLGNIPDNISFDFKTEVMCSLVENDLRVFKKQLNTSVRVCNMNDELANEWMGRLLKNAQ